MGLGVYDRESRAVDKLGKPSAISIVDEGVSKFIYYEKYQVAFNIKKNTVEAVCVTATDLFEG
jgi:hypothetical protein